MARYIVEGPDGKRYIVEGPDGAAAPAQGGSHPLAPQTQPAALQPFQRAGANAGWGRGNVTPASAGINDAVIKTGLGLKSLFTDLSEDDRYALAGMRQEKEEDPEGFKRGAGEFGGNVLIGALPGSKIASGASKLVGAGRALAPYFGTAMGAAGTEFAQHPAEGEGAAERLLDKAGSAGKAAVLAPLMQLGLRGLGKAVTQPFKPSPEAEKLMAQGFTPTLQQGAAGTPGKLIGGLTSGALPVKRRLKDEAANVWLGRITEGKVQYKDDIAENFLAAAKQALGDEYSAFWKGHTVNLSPKRVADLGKATGMPLSNMRQDRAAREAQGIVMDILGDGSVNLRMKYDTFADEVRNPLSTAMREAKSEGVRARISAARDMLDNTVTRQGKTVGEVERLKDIDRRMFDLKRGEEAVTPAALAQEGLDIAALSRAYAKNIPQAAKVGNTTYKDFIEPAAHLIGNTPAQYQARALMTSLAKTGGVGALSTALAGTGLGGVATGGLVGLSLLGQTGKGAKVLMGGTEAQKKMAKILQELGPAAQALYTGTATTNAEGEE